jgi:hypothetical protein
MPEQQNERSDSHEVTDITPVRGNTPRRGNNEITYSSPIRGNNEATFVTPMQGGNNEVTYPTPMRGNNEATFITPMQGGNNEVTYTAPIRGNNEATFVTPMQGGNNEMTYRTRMQGSNNEATYTAPMPGNNERTYITDTERQDERLDLITTRPVPVVSAPSTPLRLNIDRRKLLLGGGAALLALVGGGAAITALTMALNNSSQRSSTVPTVVPKPRALVPGTNILTIAAHSDAVTNVLWDPTGRYLTSSSIDNSIKLWDVGNIVQKQTANPPTLSQPAWAQTFKTSADFGFDTLHWSADGRKLVTLAIDQDNHAKPLLLSPFTNDTQGQFFTNTTLTAPSFNNPVLAPHGTTLAAIDTIARHYHKVDLWQMSKPGAPMFSLTYQNPDQFVGDFDTLGPIAWSCDGSLLAGLFSSQLSKARSIVIWDVKTRAVKAALPLAGLSVDLEVFRYTLSWSPVNPHMLAVFNLNTIAVVDASQGKQLYQLGTDDPDASQPVNPNKERITHRNGYYLVARWSLHRRQLRQQQQSLSLGHAGQKCAHQGWRSLATTHLSASQRPACPQRFDHRYILVARWTFPGNRILR